MICKYILLVTFLNEPKLILLHIVECSQVLLFITNNLIKNQLFANMQLNYQTILFLTIQFSISHLFLLTLYVKHYYLTHTEDPIRCYHSGPKWTWKQWRWRSIPHSQMLQHYRSLTIKLFKFINRILVAVVLPLCKDTADWAYFWDSHYHHVTLLAWFFLTLTRYPSQSSIAPGRSSRQYPLSALGCFW